MPNETVWSTAYLLGLSFSFAARWVATRAGFGLSDQVRATHRRDSLVVTTGQILWALAQLAVGVRAVSTRLAFAEYSLPSGLRTLGLILFTIALALLWRAHRDLGTNWDHRIALHTRHELITHGVYRWLRHPLYAAYGLWSVALCLLIPNALVGPIATVGISLVYLGRVPAEERMMKETFGDAYTEYTRRTHRLVPKVFQHDRSDVSHE